MEQKIALVTGGTGGIGFAAVNRLVTEGYWVYFTYSSNQSKAFEMEKTVNNCTGIKYSVGDDASVIVNMVIEERGRIDVLVNNLGITNDKLFARMKREDFDQVLEVNVGSMFDFTKAVIRPMSKKKYGRIVNISSIVGVTGNIGQANYAASKAAMVGFTKSIAQEYARKGITSNVISPGFIETEMTAKLDDQIKDDILNRIAMNRMAKPSEVASVISFLASEDSSYITGQNIIVDGGMR